MSGVRINAADFVTLAHRLDRMTPNVLVAARAVVAKGSLNIKKDAQKRIGRGPHHPNYAATIGYSVIVKGLEITGEIGPDKGKTIGGGPHRTPGNLGNIYEYGSPTHAPIPHLGPALDDEAPRFADQLELALVKALGG